MEGWNGISEAFARRRLDAEGPNELPSTRRRGPGALVLDLFREPMVALLLLCGGIYVILGDLQEALFLIGFTVLILVITFHQENKTERALDSLRSLASPRALVVRDGRKARIAGRDVVRDDLLVLAEGDRVPADALLVSETNLLVDESLLTGESVPVEKSLSSESMVWAGTTVVRGQGLARVTATGLHTEIGKIGKVIETTAPSKSILQFETRRLVRRLAVGATALCVLVVVVYGFARQDWLQGFLSGLTLAMAILPNELPAVLMIFLSLGAWRISQREVLARRLNAVESLGSITALCVDKTGTLTLNQMSVRKLYSAECDCVLELRWPERKSLPEEFHRLIEYGILASSQSPFDPMEKAVLGTGFSLLANTEHLHPDWFLEREYPLSSEMRAVSQVWKQRGPGRYVVGTKGAPEAIIDLCHMDEARAARVTRQVESFARKGLRVIGVAASTAAAEEAAKLPGKQHDFDFEFLGLLGFSDPVRSGVPEAVAECRQAGIRVIMITGDHERTAAAIAREIGLAAPDDVLTGSALDSLSASELARRLKTVNCFARMKPQQKLRIVEALAANGEIVAMTGDGVNDVPALHAANVGIAMGARGTDVARESAAVVLLNDDFSSIVEAIRTGRRVFDNLQSAMSYLLAVHVPIAGISVLPILMGLPLVLLPVHVAFLHLIIEPACSVVYEAEPAAADVMQRPPRRPEDPLFSSAMVKRSVYQGACVFVGVFMIFFVALKRGQGDLDARAMAFTTLIFANLVLILVNRSNARSTGKAARALRIPSNRALNWTLSGALVILALVLSVPWLRELFRFSVLHPIDLLICFVASLSPLLVLRLARAQS
jgi:Ca2+-transporting ATPase